VRVMIKTLVAVFCLISGSNSAFADTAKTREITFAGATGVPVYGTLYRSHESDGFLPAVILQHDCFGLKNFHRNQARRLAEMGYFALLIDSFQGTGSDNTCATSPGLNINDAVGARRYLEAVHGVDDERIGLIGWGTNTDLDGPLPFAAMVAIYPECPTSAAPNPDMPLLILTGAKDNWMLQNQCLDYIKRQPRDTNQASIRIYPDAHHSFDNIELDKPKTVQNVWFPSDQKSGPVKIAYNRLAHEDALKRIEDFLNDHLQLTLAKAYPSKAYSPLPLHADTDDTPSINSGRGHWVINPSTAGDNLPTVGRSVFDRLFSITRDGKAAYEIPFPYTKLVAFLNNRLLPGRSGGEPVKQVLFPMGRSLQREASAPDYFSSPRIVVAIDGEPNPAVSDNPILLKDRLYFGYVESTNVLEVISYNEAASRFEFQIVKNYAPGKTPDVFYANRRLCTSCHQNKSPLFSRENWTETNAAGGVVAKKLRWKLGKKFHGVTVIRSGEVPAKIDLSTDRANLFSVLQMLWREGCGISNDSEGIKCRAAAYQAMVQFRLSNTHDFDRDDPLFKQDFVSVITRNWRQFWPGGLFIPNSDIPDRNPLGVRSAITGTFDPLTKRGPMEIWSGYQRSDPERLITGFSDQFTTHDIEKLDRFLVANSTDANTQVINASCTVAFNPRRGLAHPLNLSCATGDNSVALDLETSLPGRQKASGKLKTLAISGMLAGDRIELNAANKHAAWFNLSRLGLAARMPDGRRVASIALTPLSKDGDPVKQFSKITRAATATIKVIDDFAVVEDAIKRLSGLDHGPFADKPFHGPKTMSALFDVLNVPSTKWCCDADAPAPPLRLDTIKPLETANVRIHAKSLALMTEACGTCHRTNNPHPPNFLSGSSVDALAGIRACAPRILHRLSLWDVPESERDQTAMPPLNILHDRGLTAEMWRQGSEIKRLREFVAQLADETGDPVLVRPHLSCANPLEVTTNVQR
jgi:dienelactone hydrolase